MGGWPAARELCTSVCADGDVTSDEWGSLQRAVASAGVEGSAGLGRW